MEGRFLRSIAGRISVEGLAGKVLDDTTWSGGNVAVWWRIGSGRLDVAGHARATAIAIDSELLVRSKVDAFPYDLTETYHLTILVI